MPGNLEVIVMLSGVLLFIGFLAAWFSHKWDD